MNFSFPKGTFLRVKKEFAMRADSRFNLDPAKLYVAADSPPSRIGVMLAGQGDIVYSKSRFYVVTDVSALEKAVYGSK